MRGTKPSFEVVKAEFKNRGYELLENEYVNNTTKMKYRCSKHSDKTLEIMYKALLSGSGCKYCGSERSNKTNSKYSLEDAEREFRKLGYELLGTKYKNSNTSLEYVCSKHPGKINKTSLGSILSGTRCKWCVWESRRRENSASWKGGVGNLHELLRSRISWWREEALERHNYRCDITNINFSDMEIHHIKPFHVIRDEILKDLGLENKDISSYSEEDLETLVGLFEKKHKEFTGIPLHSDLHKLFHRLYGFQTTFEEYQEFKQRYLDGEFHVESIEKWKEETAKRLRARKEKPNVVYKGSKVSFAEASKITGISVNTLFERYKRGDRGEKLFRPVKGLGCAKLSEEETKEIREMLKKGIKQCDIARKFGVAQSLITLIKQGKVRRVKM